MHCPHCNQEHPKDTRFCPISGKEIIQADVCPNCGKPVDSSWVHCINCGRKLERAEGKSIQPGSHEPDLPRTPISTQGSPNRMSLPVIPCLIITGVIGILIILTVIMIYLIRQAPNIPLDPTIAPSGRIVFVSNRDGNTEIYVMDADGSNQTRLTNNSEQMDDNHPAWSTDGSKIAFVSTRDGYQPEIYVMNADGSNQTRLTYDQAGDYYPVWSPDGQKIAFVSDRDGKYKICVMNADGSYQTCLSDSELGNISPSLGVYGVDTAKMGVSWSPDGQKIIYSSRRSGNAKIYVMNNDGGSQANLTNDWGDTDPDWSPDGREILFVSEREGHSEIYIMNADGSSQTRLTDTIEGVSSSPAWSTDGRQIAFQSDQAGKYEIFVMAADGSNLTRLTNNQAEDWNPDWAPVVFQDPTGTPKALPDENTGSGAISEMLEISQPYSRRGVIPIVVGNIFEVVVDNSCMRNISSLFR